MNSAPSTHWKHRWAPAAWALFFAVAANAVVTVEWSSPYCNDPQDGPAYAAFGFPLPFARYSGVSSLLYFFMPLAYGFNLVCLGALFFLGTSHVRAKTLRAGLVWRRIVAFLGVTLAVLALAAELAWAALFYSAVPSFGNAWEPYFSYRPVGISAMHSYCKPSEFWFGPVKPPAGR